MLHDFWSHGQMAAQLGLGDLIQRGKLLSEAQVHYLAAVVMEHDILYLEISVHGIDAVQPFEPVEYLKEVFDGCVLRQGAFVLEQLPEVFTVAVLKYKKLVLVFNEMSVQFYNVGMVTLSEDGLLAFD